MEVIHVSAEPEGILALTFVGEVNGQTDLDLLKGNIDTVSKAIKDYHIAQGKRIKVIVNVTDFKAEYISEAANALAKLAKQDKELVEKTAVYGGSTKIILIGETIVALSGRTNIRFFESKEKAIKWLNS